jgi:hypothetical protein
MVSNGPYIYVHVIEKNIQIKNYFNTFSKNHMKKAITCAFS